VRLYGKILLQWASESSALPRSKSQANPVNGAAMHPDGFNSPVDQVRREHVPVTGRRVIYEYCISFVVVTLRRTSRVHQLKPGESGLLKGLPYTLLTVLFGWWGIPWGVVYTPLALLTYLSGGRDVTGLSQYHRT